MNGQPVRKFLCVRIRIDDDDARQRDGMWKQIGGKYTEKRSHIPQTTDNLQRVHYVKSVVTVRGQPMRRHLYSRYNRQVIAKGNAVLNFNSILILSLPGVTCVLQTHLGPVLDRRVA